MCQTKKGNQWYFGMKAHIGVDSKSRMIHAVAATAANVHDSQMLPDLLHGEETRIWGDSAYSGQGETIQACAPQALDFTNHKGCRNRPLTRQDRARNRIKSWVCARVEHSFHVLNRVFAFVKVCYRGLDKNTKRVFTACGLVNLSLARQHLLRQAVGECAHGARHYPLIR